MSTLTATSTNYAPVTTTATTATTTATTAATATTTITTTNANKNAKTKKLLNGKTHCSLGAIRGLLCWNPGLVNLDGYENVVLRQDWKSQDRKAKVSLLTGGGSGHEPCFYGYVGEGMLTAAVHGDVFAAPSPKSILATIMALNWNRQGVLILINNYTGDRVNFGLAAEKARSRGVKVEIVLNADDCALNDGWKEFSRRGLAGIILLYKIVGHLIESGESFEKVTEFAREAVTNIATMGVSWSSCSLPGGGPLFELGANEMEIGLGMHGEAGIKRTTMKTTKETVSILLDHMVNRNITPSLMTLNKGDRVVVLVNNMGSTTEIEMNVLAMEVLVQLCDNVEVTVDRMYVSKFLTSLEMSGISISIMTTNDFKNYCLDSKTKSLSWVRPVMIEKDSPSPAATDGDNGGSSSRYRKIYGSKLSNLSDSNDGPIPGPQLDEAGHKIFVKCITGACNAFVANTDLLNKWDSACGDGDCGNTFASGARGMYKLINDEKLVGVFKLKRIFELLSETVEDSMGGTSGGIYSLLLTSMGQEMGLETKCTSTSETWIRGLRKGMEKIIRYGGAEPGSRTMLDPLNGVCTFLEKEFRNMDTLTLWQSAVKIAEIEMKRTKDMEAGAGRAMYVNKSNLVHPDPGAKAFCVALSAIANVLVDNRKYFE